MAEDWQEAPSKAERDRIFKETGVRWSELLRLPYWDPTRFVIVDAMHNLFLGLVKHHIETVLGVREAGKPNKRADCPLATKDELLAARKVLSKGLKKKSDLKKVKKPALLGLCAENQIELPRPAAGEITRATMVDVLIVSLDCGFME